MARTRSIKPSFFDNEILGDLPPLTRLLFIGLWCIADREGRLQDRPKRIKKELLGYDDVTTDTVNEMLQSLHESGFICRYDVEGTKYIHIINFVKHQNPHIKEKSSEIPPSPMESLRIKKECYLMPMSDQESTAQELCSPAVETQQAVPSPAEEEQNPDSSKKNIQEERFVIFWSAYPRKKSKGNAEKAWKKIGPDKDLFETILTSLEKAKKGADWIKNNGQFIPYPATWLNAKGWEDEYHDDKPTGGNSPNTADDPLTGFQTE